MARTEIDTDNKKSKLDILVSGNFETAYSYDNGDVTLSERVNVAMLSRVNFRANLDEINRWISDVTIKLHPKLTSRDEFEDTVKKKSNKVIAKFTNKDDILFTDAEFKFNHGTFDFQPRPEITLNFQCFKSWYSFLERFYEATL